MSADHALIQPPPPMHIGGQGTPLVLLHGIGGTWEIWKPVLPQLEAHHRVIALTLPGHLGGPPVAGEGDATVARLADQVIGILRDRGIDRAHVAGNSLGGWLSLELARRGFASTVTAFSPAGGWRNDDDYRAIAKPFRIFFAVAGVILALATPLARFAWVRRTLTREMMECGERLPRSDFLQILRAMANTSVLPALLRTMNHGGFTAMSPGGTVPIVVAWGEHDRVIPYEKYGASFRDRIDRLAETVVAAAGHVPMWDNPQGVVAQILAATGPVDQLQAFASAREPSV